MLIVAHKCPSCDNPYNWLYRFKFSYDSDPMLPCRSCGCELLDKERFFILSIAMAILFGALLLFLPPLNILWGCLVTCGPPLLGTIFLLPLKKKIGV